MIVMARKSSAAAAARQRGEKGVKITTKLSVRDIMRSPVVSLSPDDSIKDVAKAMRDKKMGSIVIVKEDGRPVGIVYDRDIVTAGVARDARPSEIRAKEVMQELRTIGADADIIDAARLLRKHNIKRLGVTDKNNRLVGIISASDVIAVEPSLVGVVSEKAALLRYDLGLPRTEGKISGYCDSCEEWSDLLQYSEGAFICEQCREDASGGSGGAAGEGESA